METFDVPFLLAALVLFGLGGAERVVDARHRQQETKWLTSATKAEGTVVRAVEPHVPSTMTASGVKTRHSVVSFQTANGWQHEFEAAVDAGLPGTRVRVAYDPRDPSSARLLSPALPTQSFGMGHVLMLAGLALGIRAFVPARRPAVQILS